MAPLPRKKPVIKDAHHTRELLEALGFMEFAEYLRSPTRILWTNFFAGVFRGVGIVIGATVVVAVLIWLIGVFIDLPLVGQYFSDLKQILERYTEIQRST